MEVGRHGRIETQTHHGPNVIISMGVAGIVRQRDPLFRGRVADDILKPNVGLGGGAIAAAEEETVAAIEEMDWQLGQEVQGGGASGPRDLEELESGLLEALLAGASAEEAGQGLGEFAGEAQPVFAHALAAPAMPGGNPRNDFEQEVVGEGLGRRPFVAGRRERPAQPGAQTDERTEGFSEGGCVMLRWLVLDLRVYT
jgi:hypothetical protein